MSGERTIERTLDREEQDLARRPVRAPRQVEQFDRSRPVDVEISRHVGRSKIQYWNARHHDRLVPPELDRTLNELVRDGATIKRIRFESELRGEYLSIANKKSEEKPDGGPISDNERQRLARLLNLPVVHGKVRIPDVRVEYLDQNARDRTRDIEIVTRSYSARQVASKASAGFHIRSDNKAKSPLREKRSTW